MKELGWGDRSQRAPGAMGTCLESCVEFHTLARPKGHLVEVVLSIGRAGVTLHCSQESSMSSKGDVSRSHQNCFKAAPCGSLVSQDPSPGL